MKRFMRRLAVRLYVVTRRWLYRCRQTIGQPVTFHVAESIRIKLFPEGQIAELLYTSRFERRDLELVSRFLRPGMRVIDVGANIGLYTILADRCVSPDGRVWAFEPSGESRARLHRNLELNGVTTVHTIRAALSDKAGGELALARDAGRGDGERFLVDGRAGLHAVGESDVELVPVTTLDDHFFAPDKDLERIDFMKIDIEGGELAVFRGARRLLTVNRDLVIMFESTPANSERYGYRQEELFEFLRGLGYRLFFWDREAADWAADEGRLKQAGNIWATREQVFLPRWEKAA
ncbi:MAG: FkbM family methyltransferase [Blastocatellia bacterium]